MIVGSREWKNSRRRDASCTMPVFSSGSSKDTSDAKTEAHSTKEARKAAFEVSALLKSPRPESCMCREKVNSYKHAIDQGLGFLPIIFETTGQMHHETLPFFVTCRPVCH